MKRHKLTLYIFMTLLLTSCMVTTKNGYDIHRTQNGAGGRVSFKDQQVLRQEALEACRNEVLDSAACAQKMAKVPLNGRLYLELMNERKDFTRPENYLYILHDLSGNELIRRNGNVLEPELRVYEGDSYWRAFDVVDIPENVQPPFKFYLVNTLNNSRSEFLIRKSEF